MAADAAVTVNMTVTGLGSKDEMTNSFSTNTVPAETIKNVAIISTSYALNLGGSGISAANTLLIESISATIFVCFGQDSGAISLAQFAIPEGESAYFPINVTDQATVAACVPVTSVYLFCSSTGICEYILLATA